MPEWTVVTLRQHVDARFDALERLLNERHVSAQKALDAALVAQREATTAALAANKEAVLKAEHASEKRFEGVNEFRQSLADQARLFMPRAEAETLYKAVDEKVAALAVRLDRTEGRGHGRRDAWGYVVAVIGTLVGLAGLIIAMLK